MYPGYWYVFHAQQPGKRDRVTFKTVESIPTDEIQKIMGNKNTVYRIKLLWEGVEEHVFHRLPPLIPEVFKESQDYIVHLIVIHMIVGYCKLF